jgi:lysine/ornithine N-monooxygenase
MKKVKLDAAEYNEYVRWFNARTKNQGYFDRELMNVCLKVFDREHKKDFWLSVACEPKQLSLF